MINNGSGNGLSPIQHQATAWTNADLLSETNFSEIESKYSRVIFIQENALENVSTIVFRPQWVNTLRPRENGRHFADDIFKCIFVNENLCIPIKISLKFVPKGPINNIPALVQIMAWRRPGDKPLSEPMMISLPTHICVTRPQWVNHSPFLGLLMTN